MQRMWRRMDVRGSRWGKLLGKVELRLANACRVSPMRKDDSRIDMCGGGGSMHEEELWRLVEFASGH
jgi:hypothetical protein